MATVRDVTPAEAAALLPQYTYLDVRTPEEFAAGHAPGAINVALKLASPTGMVPNPHFMDEAEAKFPNKAELLIVACKSGMRSGMAVQILCKVFTELVNMPAGWDGWTAAGLPVEK